MNSIILYSSYSGNTDKIAHYIAKNLNINCIKIDKNTDYNKLNLDNYDLIFIGSGIYGGKIHKDMINFLDSIDLKSNKKFAFFISSAGRGNSYIKAVDECRDILKAKNQTILDNYFNCFGKFLFFKRNHPDENDLQQAIQWAKEVISKF